MSENFGLWRLLVIVSEKLQRMGQKQHIDCTSFGCLIIQQKNLMPSEYFSKCYDHIKTSTHIVALIDIYFCQN